MNLEIGELIWVKYRCENCGEVYKSTGERSICPECKSEKVTRV
jgi:predicted Zn-ribbon and HTH transcriptional regulator